MIRARRARLTEENAMAIKALIAASLAATLTLGTANTAWSQTIKIGVVNTLSGGSATLGEMIEKGYKLYLKLHENSLPPGIKLEFIVRDDGGPNPDNAKRLAQELIVRDRVQLLTGLAFSPNAAAVAPLAAEAKLPVFIMNAGTSAITTLSPYVSRYSFTLWQSCLPLGEWAAKKFKRVYTAVSDYGPGHDCEAAFVKGYKDNGGELAGSVRMPVSSPDFVPFMLRVKDAKPDAVMGFIPAGRQATAIMKAYGDLGLDKAGIKFIGPGDITTDEELPNMGDVPLGVLTVHHYSAAAERPANKAFVAAWKKEYGEKTWPSFMSVGGWDAMDAIFHVIRVQNGRIDPDKTMQLVKEYKNANSPRGPISIDPDTRDIVQNIYLREVRRVGGALANVELETIATAVKDPWKEINKKK